MQIRCLLNYLVVDFSTLCKVLADGKNISCLLWERGTNLFH